MIAADKLDLGTLRVRAGDGNFTVRLAQAAYEHRHLGEAYLLSIVGPANAVKAIYASMSGGGKDVELELSDWEGMYSTYYLKPHREQGGYRRFSRLLGFNTWHITIVSKREDFLLNASPEAVWQMLNGPGYSTPLLKSWMPYVIQKLEANGDIERLGCFQCDAARLTVTSEGLDEIVSEGLRRRHITIPREEAAA
jgi:hypothetical protein